MQSNGASQQQLSRVVKEDLKKILLTRLKNITRNQSLDERQIYGLQNEILYFCLLP
jgi:hypothetical protein